MLSCLIYAALLISSVSGLQLEIPNNVPRYKNQIRPYFPGFSIEWDQIRTTFLKNPKAPILKDLMQNLPKIEEILNKDTVQLFRNFALHTKNPFQNTSTLIRIGGNSSINLWWEDSPIEPRLANQTIVLEALDLLILDTIANITNAKLVLNIGMPSAIPLYTGALIDAFQTYITQSNIQALEIGHEMDNAEDNGSRNEGYTTEAYLTEFLAYQVSLQRRYPTIDLMGPSFGYRWRAAYHVPFMKRFTEPYKDYDVPFVRGFTETVKYFSFHKYGIRGCRDTSTLESLLNGILITDSSNGLDPGEFTHEYVSNYTLLVNSTDSFSVWGEGASVSCGGVAGVSDAFGSALWTLDSLFDYANRGVAFGLLSGTPNMLYAPISVDDNGVVIARPTYYGMLLFSSILGGSNSSVYKPQVSGTNTRIKVWGAFDSFSDTHTFVVIIKEAGDDFQVVIDSPNAIDGTSAQVLELTSNALTDVIGFKLGGVSFPNPDKSAYKEISIFAKDKFFKLNAKSGAATVIRISGSGNAKQILRFE